MASLRLRHDFEAKWLASSRVLAPGEPGYCLDTGILKIGDGRRLWKDLDEFLPNSELQAFIDAAVKEADLNAGESAHEELMDHVNSLNPHPAYDDGQSFLLLYENAKV